MWLPVPRDAGAAESTGVRPLPFWEGPPTPTPATRVAERAVGSICSLGGLLLEPLLPNEGIWSLIGGP